MPIKQTEIISRLGKGSPLTHSELDNNFSILKENDWVHIDDDYSIASQLEIPYNNTEFTLHWKIAGFKKTHSPSTAMVISSEGSIYIPAGLNNRTYVNNKFVSYTRYHPSAGTGMYRVFFKIDGDKLYIHIGNQAVSATGYVKFSVDYLISASNLNIPLGDTGWEIPV